MERYELKSQQEILIKLNKLKHIVNSLNLVLSKIVKSFFRLPSLYASLKTIPLPANMSRALFPGFFSIESHTRGNDIGSNLENFTLEGSSLLKQYLNQTFYFPLTLKRWKET